MASYWKSNPRYFCEICKCWLADNKVSIEFHERGKSHKEKKERRLSELRKSSAESFKNQQKAGVYLRQMEDAAVEAYKKDLARQGLLIDGTLPNLAPSRPAAGIHSYHFQEPAGSKKKVKIHNIEDFRESKIVKNSPWIKQVSPEGEEYYWNSETGKSQWKKPETYVESAAKSKPETSSTGKKPGGSHDHTKPGKSPWKKQTSPDGDVYYWNSKTGQSRWEKPEASTSDNEENDRKNKRKIPGEKPKTGSKCLWTKEVSPEGHTYYWNSETGKSQWEKPDDYIETKAEEESPDDSPTQSKKPKRDPYGSWTVIRESKPFKKQVDWQLPAKPDNPAKDGLVDRNALENMDEPEPTKFDEKVITSLDSEEGGSTTFKKKTTKQRSIRKRNTDD